MPPENRIRNLSTRWLKPLKIWLFVLYVGLGISILYVHLIMHDRMIVFAIGQSAIYIWLLIKLLKGVAKLHRVEFDNDYIYVLKKKQDLIIPLEHVESVEIASLGGLYKVNLYHADQVGKEFFFKQSLWYPLNYKRCDDLVNVLRRNIDVAKRRRPALMPNTLHS